MRRKPSHGSGWGPVAFAVFKIVGALTRLEGSTPSHSRQKDLWKRAFWRSTVAFTMPCVPSRRFPSLADLLRK